MPPLRRGLAGEPVTASRRHQVTDIGPPPEPKVTQYVAQAKECPCCGTVTEGELPAHVRARARYGPEACAQAANLTCGHYIPVHRATVLLCQLAGITASTGWMAGIRARAAALIGDSGFIDRVRELLRAAPAVHADETPARAAGGTRYVHLACTTYLTHMHAGDRSAEAIDAGQVLPGYSGVIVRDGYAGYGHLTDALHAWCGARLLRDLKGLYGFEPQKQEWASRMAALLIEARDAAAAARLAGQPALEPAVLEDLLTRYRALTTAGLTANLYRRTATAKDARRLARRFRIFEDLILRFATRPDLDIFTNDLASYCTSKQVRDLTKMSWGSAEFLREDVIEASPMIWYIQVDGLIVDSRELPLPVQAQAFDLGVIPYIPALGRDGTTAWLSESGSA